MVRMQSALLRAAFLASLALSLGVQREAAPSYEGSMKDIRKMTNTKFDVLPLVASDRIAFDDAFAKSYRRPEATRRTLRSLKPEQTIRKAPSAGTTRRIVPVTATKRRILEDTWRRMESRPAIRSRQAATNFDPASSIMAQVGRTGRNIVLPVASSGDAKISKGFVKPPTRRQVPSVPAPTRRRAVALEIQKKPKAPPPPPGSARKHKAAPVPAKRSVLMKAERTRRPEVAKRQAIVPRYTASVMKRPLVTRQPESTTESSMIVPTRRKQTSAKIVPTRGDLRKEPTKRRQKLPSSSSVSSTEESVEPQSSTTTTVVDRYNTRRRVEVAAPKKPSKKPAKGRGKKRALSEDEEEDLTSSSHFVPERTKRIGAHKKPSRVVKPSKTSKGIGRKGKKQSPPPPPPSSSEESSSSLESSEESTPEYVPTHRTRQAERTIRTVPRKPATKHRPKKRKVESSETVEEELDEASSVSEVKDRRKKKPAQTRRKVVKPAATTRKIKPWAAAATRTRVTAGTKRAVAATKRKVVPDKKRKKGQRRGKGLGKTAAVSSDSSSSDFFEVSSSSIVSSEEPVESSSVPPSSSTYIPPKRHRATAEKTRRDLRTKRLIR